MPRIVLVRRTPKIWATLSAVKRNNPHLAGALEYVVNWKIAAEDKILAVLDLVDGVLAPQVDRGNARSLKNFGSSISV